MFNKKLKEQIELLKHENETLWGKINDYSWMEEKQQKEIEGLKEVIEAQGIIITAFADFIVKTTQPKKKGVKNGK